MRLIVINNDFPTDGQRGRDKQTTRERWLSSLLESGSRFKWSLLDMRLPTSCQRDWCSQVRVSEGDRSLGAVAIRPFSLSIGSTRTALLERWSRRPQVSARLISLGFPFHLTLIRAGMRSSLSTSLSLRTTSTTGTLGRRTATDATVNCLTFHPTTTHRPSANPILLSSLTSRPPHDNSNNTQRIGFLHFSDRPRVLGLRDFWDLCDEAASSNRTRLFLRQPSRRNEQLPITRRLFFLVVVVVVAWSCTVDASVNLKTDNTINESRRGVFLFFFPF